MGVPEFVDLEQSPIIEAWFRHRRLTTVLEAAQKCLPVGSRIRRRLLSGKTTRWTPLSDRFLAAEAKMRVGLRHDALTLAPILPGDLTPKGVLQMMHAKKFLPLQDHLLDGAA